jgi:hypothetical protein
MTTAEDRITALEAVVEALADQLQKALALAATPSPPPPPPAPPPPERWAARADTDDWTDLMDWVDGLTADYSLFGDYPILPCWPAHPGVVEELAALRRAWVVATITDTVAGPAGNGSLTAWHDQWLWPCLERVKAGHYTISSCRQHHEPGRAHRALTDRFIVGP